MNKARQGMRDFERLMQEERGEAAVGTDQDGAWDSEMIRKGVRAADDWPA